MNQEEFERAVRELRAGTEVIRPSDVFVFSEPLRSALNHAVRLGRLSLSEFAEELKLGRDQARQIAEVLISRKLFQSSRFSNDQEIFYDTRMSAMTRPLTRPPSDLLKKIDD